MPAVHPCPTGLRELDATFKGKKPYFVVHEADKERGGQPLEVLRADCVSTRSQIAQPLFDEGTPLITWHRVQDYQLLSLRMIAELTVHEMPLYASLKQPPKLYLRNDILAKEFAFKEKPTLYVSADNPGAMEVADQLLDKYGVAGLSVSLERPPEFAAYDIKSTDRNNEATDWMAAPCCTHMLLYLCTETFVGAVGQRLAHEIREAQRRDLRIVMVHECDSSKNGCPFAHFFRTTPDDLVSAGLYGTIANAFHKEPYRQVSMAAVAKALGAVELKGSAKKRQALKRRRSSGGQDRADAIEVVLAKADSSAASTTVSASSTSSTSGRAPLPGLTKAPKAPSSSSSTLDVGEATDAEVKVEGVAPQTSHSTTVIETPRGVGSTLNEENTPADIKP